MLTQVDRNLDWEEVKLMLSAPPQVSIAQFLDLYGQHATGHDMLFAGHCRLRQYNGEVLPLIGPFVRDNPDGVFPDYTLELAQAALCDTYRQTDSTSLFALLLNNVEIGRDERTCGVEPDLRRRRAEGMLADYLLDVREEWVEGGIPRSALAWFRIGDALNPFIVESHNRSMMDNRIGELARKSDHVVLETAEDALYYYFVPEPGEKYLITAFPRGSRGQQRQLVLPEGGVRHLGTGCAGEVAMLLRNVSQYVPLGQKAVFQPRVLFNLAPQQCHHPVSIGTRFAYHLYHLPFKTVNIFFDPACMSMTAEVFQPES